MSLDERASDALPFQGPDKGDCEGDRSRCTVDDCPKFGRLVKPSKDGKRRVKGCGDPVARGKRNKRSGQRKQRAAAKVLRVPLNGLGSGHEENWPSVVLTEVKSGAQVKPVATRYRNARAQAEAKRAIGDHRPFVFVAMPEGESGGLVVVHTDDLENVVAALAEVFGGVA